MQQQFCKYLISGLMTGRLSVSSSPPVRRIIQHQKVSRLIAAPEADGRPLWSR